MTRDVWNLVAAILCTLGSGLGTGAFFLSDPSPANQMAALGAAVATGGGIAWIVAAVIALRDEGER